MSDHGLQFTAQSNRPIVRVEFASDEPAYPWYPVHAWLHRAGVYPLLSPSARSLLDVFLWQAWEQQQRPGMVAGQVVASIEQLAAWCGDSTRTTFRAVGLLLEPPAPIVTITGSPACLLAKLGPTLWQPMPGRYLAGRKGRVDATPAATVGTAIDTPVPNLAQNCQRTSAPHREARARQITHSKAREETQIQKTEPGARTRLVSEWPEPDLLGTRAIERRDVRGLLLSLKVWHYAAEALALCPDISVEMVMDTAREVAADHGARNKPRYLAGRLARMLGINLPDCPGSKRLTAEQMAGPLGGIERLRRDRAKLFSIDDGPRGMSSTEYARSEDE